MSTFLLNAKPCFRHGPGTIRLKNEEVPEPFNRNETRLLNTRAPGPLMRPFGKIRLH